MNLKQAIAEQALEFAEGILHAMRNSSIDELMSMTKELAPSGQLRLPAATLRGSRISAITGGGRLGRRSRSDLSRVLTEIVVLLQKHPDGLRAEAIKSELGLDARELPRPLSDGLAAGRIKKTGQKRATTYFAGLGGSSAASASPKAKRTSQRAKRARV